MSTKETRQKAHVSQSAAAAIARVSITTWRMYEVDRNSITAEPRAKCDAALVSLGEIAARREAA